MGIEYTKNRDLFFKVCFMCFLTHILKIFGIDEEIVEISGTEIISLENIGMPKLFDNFIDFSAFTKSGKILLFEFKKYPLTTRDLKQVYDYYDRVHCKKKKPVRFIIITISNKGKIDTYMELDITFHPKIIKTKLIDKRKELNIIRDKFKNNKRISSYECSLLVASPLLQIDETEAEIVEEMCRNIGNNKNCISEDDFDNVVLAMYLNIIEYIDDDRQDELMEMINLTEEFEGVIAEIKKEGKEEGIEKGREEGIEEGMEKGRIDFIKELLRNHSIEEVSEFTGFSTAYLISMIVK